MKLLPIFICLCLLSFCPDNNNDLPNKIKQSLKEGFRMYNKKCNYSDTTYIGPLQWTIDSLESLVIDSAFKIIDTKFNGELKNFRFEIVLGLVQGYTRTLTSRIYLIDKNNDSSYLIGAKTGEVGTEYFVKHQTKENIGSAVRANNEFKKRRQNKECINMYDNFIVILSEENDNFNTQIFSFMDMSDYEFYDSNISLD